MARRIDVYFSLISPWAHLGHAPFVSIATRHDAEISWNPVPLGRLFAETGGLPLAKRAIERQRYRAVELQRWAAKRDRPIKLQPKHWPFNPSLADRCVLALVSAGENPAGFIGAASRGAWEEELDLADRETIAAILAAEGHDSDAVFGAAETPAIVEAYAANRDVAQSSGVFGSPTYVLDGEPFWGQDRLDMLDEALASGRPPYRADA